MHVLRTLVVCLHLSLALAHVPVFPPATSSSDAFKLEAVTEKSYGVSLPSYPQRSPEAYLQAQLDQLLASSIP